MPKSDDFFSGDGLPADLTGWSGDERYFSFIDHPDGLRNGVFDVIDVLRAHR